MGVESKPIFVDTDQLIAFAEYEGCVSYTVMNKGTENCTLFGNFPLNSGDAPLTVDYNWPKQRKDQMDIRFGNNALVRSLFIWITIDSEFTP
jgi:hypothetical protein